MMDLKDVRRSFTGELRWVRRKYVSDTGNETLFMNKVLQQQVLIEGTENGIWVQRHEWKDVKLVKEENDGGKQTGL